LQVELRFVDSKIYSLYIIIFEQGKMRYILIKQLVFATQCVPQQTTKVYINNKVKLKETAKLCPNK
jgi:hypothetical protein